MRLSLLSILFYTVTIRVSGEPQTFSESGSNVSSLYIKGRNYVPNCKDMIEEELTIKPLFESQRKSNYVFFFWRIKFKVPFENELNQDSGRAIITSKKLLSTSSIKNVNSKVSLRGGELIERDDRDLQIIPMILGLGAFLPAFLVMINESFFTFWRWFYLDGPGILNPFTIPNNTDPWVNLSVVIYWF